MDRYHFSGVEPAETDLPAGLIAALEKVGAGETARVGELAARIIARSPAPGAGYQPLCFVLEQGAQQQADLAALSHLAEPYARPHEDDAAFYAKPRLADHLDVTAQAVWREFTGRFVLEGMRVLDLMASHDSHLPDTCRPSRLVGLGMNAAELAANRQLSESLVHDLNAEPRLPFAEDSFDLVLCALSIEYLVRPEAVLREVGRVLKPGGRCVVSFSERWFPPKAVAPWPKLPPFARVAWVLRHFMRAGFVDLQTESLRGLPRPANDPYARQTPLADPLYAVWGTR
ncbi:MAG: methyltransferase domain-containing protein [Rhodocyclaceae bacterium]|nr:methyltransferase domain-containing protein [Rhodocyclaceae bacterium]